MVKRKTLLHARGCVLTCQQCYSPWCDGCVDEAQSYKLGRRGQEQRCHGRLIDLKAVHQSDLSEVVAVAHCKGHTQHAAATSMQVPTDTLTLTELCHALRCDGGASHSSTP